MDALLSSLSCAVAIAVALWAAREDLRSRRVPNRLTLPAMLAGLCLHGAAGGPAGLWFSLAGLLTGFGLLILFHVFGGMGAGDVKLLAAAGALLGAEGAQSVFIIALAVSGAVSLVRLGGGPRGLARIGRRFSLELLGAALARRLPRLAGLGFQPASGLCFAPFVAVGVVGSLVWRLAGHPYVTLA